MNPTLPILFVLLKKGDEHWLIGFRPDRTAEAFCTIGRWAGDPELDFSWYDAAVLSQLLRELITRLETCPAHDCCFLAGEDLQAGDLVYWDEKTQSLKR